MSLAFGIVLVVVSVIATLIVLAMFVWAAYKDGQDNDAIQSRFLHRRWPREQR